MKNRNTFLALIGGVLLGASLVLCIAAAENSKKDTSHLQVVSYPSGATGIFDPDNGKLYLYDINLVNCYEIREIATLGDPLRRTRN
jgi:hypothetical protein